MALKRIWDNHKVLGSVRKNRSYTIRVAAATRDGFRYIMLSLFEYRYKKSKWIPAYKQHISIPLMYNMDKTCTKWLQPAQEVVKLMVDAIELAATMPLVDEENTVWVDRITGPLAPADRAKLFEKGPKRVSPKKVVELLDKASIDNLAIKYEIPEPIPNIKVVKKYES